MSSVEDPSSMRLASAAAISRCCLSISPPSQGSRERVDREARAVSSLNHPNICGSAATLCNARSAGRWAWSRDGLIVFNPISDAVRGLGRRRSTSLRRGGAAHQRAGRGCAIDLHVPTGRAQISGYSVTVDRDGRVRDRTRATTPPLRSAARPRSARRDHAAPPATPGGYGSAGPSHLPPGALLGVSTGTGRVRTRYRPSNRLSPPPVGQACDPIAGDRFGRESDRGAFLDLVMRPSRCHP